MKADALMRFILSGNRSLEEFAVLLARISLGVFFAISGGNKLFVASQYKLMYETIVGAGIPFPHVMTYFVSSVEFVGGCLLIIGLLSTLCCMAFIIDMIVAITTVQLATITKALSFIDWLDDFLYLPEVMYIIIFLWLISSGPGRLSVDHWIAVRSGLLDGVSADQRDTQAVGSRGLAPYAAGRSMSPRSDSNAGPRRVMIVGVGFAGPAATRKPAFAAADILLIEDGNACSPFSGFCAPSRRS